MDPKVVKRVVADELEKAGASIIERLLGNQSGGTQEGSTTKLTPLPDNEKYQQALDLYRAGASHSRVSKELGTPMTNVKRYYNWLVNKGYLTAPEEPLSEMESKVVDCLFVRGMSLSGAAKELGIAIPNVAQRRDSALRKGYKPSKARGVVDE